MDTRTLLVVLGTEGSRDAADRLIDGAVSRARDTGARLMGLYAIDDAWSRISSADWLSTGPSRAAFDRYMAETLREEGADLCGRLLAEAEKAGLTCRFEMAEGEPDELVLLAASAHGAREVMTSTHKPRLARLLADAGSRLLAAGR